MAYSVPCIAHVNVGLIHVKIAYPFNSTLVTLGIAHDQIQISEQKFWHEAHSDANGGQAGPPTEMQYLGEIHTVRMRLAAFTASSVNLLRKLTNTTLGTIDQAQIGAFQLTSSSCRLLLDTLSAGDAMNYWCALPQPPMEIGVGTKYSEWDISFVCHRPPCGHAKAGILRDTNIDAYS